MTFKTREIDGCIVGTSPYMRRGAGRVTLFDRDDTLVWDRPGRVLREDHVRLVPNARKVLAHSYSRGFSVGILTNQSAIGRGLLDREGLGAIMDRLAQELWDEQTQMPLFQFWLACPHLPDRGCHCRKPQPGMIRLAAAMHDNPAAIAVFGNHISDVQAASAAGAEGHLVRPGQLEDVMPVLQAMA